MGDIVYPGVLIKRAHPHPKPELLKDFLKAYLNGEDSDVYEDGEPKVKIFYFKETSSRILVTGIKLPFNEIRVALGSNLFMKRPVFIQTPDFGIPRDEKGRIIDHTMLELHNRLRQGHGSLGIMDVFQPQFREQLGNMEELSSKIYFGDVKHFIRTFMLQKAGTLILYGNVPGRIESSSGFNIRAHSRITTSSDEGMKATEIEYEYIMEALQAICLYNRNSKFSLRQQVTPQQISFITSNDNFLCKLTRHDGLGKGGKILDVKGTLSVNQGFIPLDMLNDNVFSMTKINGFSGECFACSSDYNFIGISPDLNWLVGTCGCSAIESYWSWHKQDYFRLFMPPRQLKLYNKYGASQGSRFQTVQKLIRGLPPKYDNVEHFKSTALGAYEMNLFHDLEQMHNQQCEADLIQASLIETVVMKTVKKDRLQVVLRVKKTRLWSEDGAGAIGKTILVPTPESFGKETRSIPISYVESNYRNNFIGVVYEILDDPLDASFSKVFLTVMVPHGQGVTSQCTVIPRPPTSSEEGVNRAVEKWKRYEVEKRLSQTIINGVVVRERYGFKTIEMNKTMSAVPITIVVKNNPAWRLIEGCLLKHYVGVEVKCDVESNNEVKKIVAEGRIVAVGQKVVGLAEYKICGILNPVVVCVVVSLPIESHAVQNSNILLKIWILSGKQSDYSVSDCAYKYETTGFNQLLKNDDYIPRMKTQMDDETLTEILKYDPKLVRIYEVKHVKLASLTAMKQIVESWRQPPAYKFPLLDFLTESSSCLNLGKLQIIKEDVTFRKDNAYRCLVNSLNESQKNAVQTMLHHKLSATRGAPGTGKTKTAITGVAMLYCLEAGLIIYSCPTNEGVEVAYQALVLMNIENRLEISIIKMQSYSREQQDLRNENCLLECDNNLLHIKVRKHPLWRACETTNFIIDKSEKDGNYSLTMKELETLASHISKISYHILALADVIFCTTACLNDFRVEFLIRDLQRGSRQFSALVVDEASLLSVPSTIPLLVLNPKRCWLVGDDLQLRTIVKNSSAENACLDVSFMEILQMRDYIMENGLFNMLDIQYRMAFLPAAVVSEYTYNGNILSADSVKSREYSSHPVCSEFPEMAKRNLAFYTYNLRNETLDLSSMSYYNDVEVELTKAILIKLLKAGVELSNVCILSFYEAHVMRLKMMIHDNMLENVKVQTVDSFQGRQSPIIILNMVRSNFENKIGFVQNGRRLNVALSRMQDFLFVVGDLQTLNKSEALTVTKLLRILSRNAFKVVRFQSAPDELSRFGEPINFQTFLDDV